MAKLARVSTLLRIPSRGFALSMQQNRVYWDAMSESYPTYLERSFLKENQTRINRLIQTFPKNAKLNLLDVGCSSGLIAKHLLDFHSKRINVLTLVDISQKMIDLTMERIQNPRDAPLNDDHPPIQVICMPWEDFSTSYHQNAVYSFLVLHLVSDVGLCLQNVYKSLKHNGSFFFSIPTIHGSNILHLPFAPIVKKYRRTDFSVFWLGKKGLVEKYISEAKMELLSAEDVSVPLRNLEESVKFLFNSTLELPEFADFSAEEKESMWKEFLMVQRQMETNKETFNFPLTYFHAKRTRTD